MSSVIFRSGEVTAGTSPITHQNLRSLIGGSIGNLIEWYDWLAYSAFSLYLAKLFFPKGDQTAQLLNTSAIFAVGYVMRPVGSLIMGVYSDLHGRRASLTLSVMLMCAGSLMIALAPTYAQVGVAAPLILLAARLMQGLSVGGEYGASATYLSEMANPKWRGLFASVQYVTLQARQLLATMLLLVLQTFFLASEQLEELGWRIPFFLGAFFAVIASYIRRNISETKAFENCRTLPGGLIRELL